MMKTTTYKEKKQNLIPKKLFALLIVLIVLLGVCIIASLLFGSRIISWTDIMDGLFHSHVDSHEANVVRQRVVRTIFSIMTGVALGVSGALMQSVTRNPIADPSILGVNTGRTLCRMWNCVLSY